MMPGPSQILTCPHCGQKKEIMSLLSGNTFGADNWSDNKCIAPMLPEISYVQKCPRCAAYFIRSRQAEVYSESDYSSECGSLSFAEAKEAFAQLSQEKFLNLEEEAEVRMLLHHAYNDYYFRDSRYFRDGYFRDGKFVRDNGPRTASEADKQLFRENALWLIENFLEDDVLKAEFYREAGNMEMAKALIEKASADDDFMKNLVTAIKEKISKAETAVFLIKQT